MRKFEVILIVIVLIGLFMKFNAWVGGDLVVIVFIGTLALLYFPLAPLLFTDRKKLAGDGQTMSKGVRIPISLGVGLALSTVCLGILFKLQHWSGATVLFYFGLFLSFIMLVLLIILMLRYKASLMQGMAVRIAILVGLGLGLMFFSPLTLVKMAYRSHPRYIEAYEAQMAAPNDPMTKARLELEGMRVSADGESFKLFEEYWYEENGLQYPDSLRE